MRWCFFVEQFKIELVVYRSCFNCEYLGIKQLKGIKKNLDKHRNLSLENIDKNPQVYLLYRTGLRGS